MTKKVYVLGAYGLIGSACVNRLLTAGFEVIGVGRSLEKGLRSNRQIEWRIADISKTSQQSWGDILGDADVIVNAAGALQDGPRDNLEAIHVKLVENITRALDGRNVTFIQISAAGADENSSTEFMRTKARGDKILMASKLHWLIFRPSLVLSRDAYGGTALLRAAAAFPLINFQIFPQSKVQTVSVEDVSHAVAKATNGLIPRGTVADLTEPNSQSFGELKQRFRDWLGFPEWRVNVPVPRWTVYSIGKIADFAGLLGWRSPLRTSSLRSLEQGITANAHSWQQTGNLPFRSLEDTLAAMPATLQERWFSRLYLMLPLSVCGLALFWLASGAIGLFALDDALEVLVSRGISTELSMALVVVGAIADIFLGLAVLMRQFSRLACIGMISLSVAYLLSSLVTAPDLWLDPLGPLVKVIPSIILAVFTMSILDER